jgi:hypothetical protein
MMNTGIFSENPMRRAQSMTIRPSLNNPTESMDSGGKFKSSKTKSGFFIRSNATGDWQLGLNVAPQKNNKYSGTATITTPNGNHQNMNVVGIYSLLSGVSTLNLTGKGGNLTLTLTASGNQSTVKTMKGKLFGQSVNYKSK